MCLRLRLLVTTPPSNSRDSQPSRLTIPLRFPTGTLTIAFTVKLEGGNQRNDNTAPVTPAPVPDAPEEDLVRI